MCTCRTGCSMRSPVEFTREVRPRRRRSRGAPALVLGVATLITERGFGYEQRLCRSINGSEFPRRGVFNRRSKSYSQGVVALASHGVGARLRSVGGGRAVRVDRARFCGSIAVALAFTLLVASCGGSDSSASQRTSPDRHAVTRSSTPSSTDPVGDGAVAAYNAMWRDMAAAALTADYQSPQLAQHAAGNALSLLVRGLYTNLRMGIVVKGQPVTHPTATNLKPTSEPTSAAINDCFDDTNWLNYKAATGELQNDVPGGRHQTTATVKETNGAWKVTELQVGAVGTC